MIKLFTLLNEGKPTKKVDETSINEENEPTNPELWDKAIAAAKAKYDVYPSAYANAFASNWYKEKGGDWKTKKESVNEVKFKDLVDTKFSIEVGSGKTTGNWSNEELIGKLKEAIKHNLFDREFYYNWTDNGKEYANVFDKDTMQPLLKNIDKTLNNMFSFKRDILTFTFKKKNDEWIDNWFKTNKSISDSLRKDYYEYRKKYAGVSLKESVNESAKSEKLAILITKVIDKVDKSLSYKDFAMAVGKILKDDYGSHVYSIFLQELNKELKRENENLSKLTTYLPMEAKSIEENLTISIKNLINDLVPMDIQNAVNPEQKERRSTFIRDLVKTLNQFYKQNRIDWRFADSNIKFKMYSKK